MYPQNVTSGVQLTSNKFSARSARSNVLYAILNSCMPLKILAVPNRLSLATCLSKICIRLCFYASFSLKLLMAL